VRMRVRVRVRMRMRVRVRLMVVQSARIAICGNLTPLTSSGGSQNNQSNSTAIISPINVAAHNIISLAKRDHTAH